MVRVEEAIKFQNEKFDTLINRMDRRFDDMDRRFEEIGRRFNRQGLYHLATFTAIVTSAVAILLNS